MIPQAPTPDDDGIPSFRAILEEDLGGPPRPAVRWQGTVPIALDVLVRLLPHYERWEFWGAGGMGVVYKAWHRELHRWAAVKFLSPGQRSDPRAVARFQNEAAVLAQLRHPNIVPVHDFGCEDDLAWLVMDFLDGVPLQQWAKEQPRKPAEIARMMAKIARAVGLAHASGITHRDMKPGNVLVMGDEPVLLDFGLAQNITWQHDTRLTQDGELAGTVAYLSPEQVQPSLGEPAPATDVHACGVMLFELLSGRLPRGGLASEIITRLHEDDLPPRLRSVVNNVRKELDAICWRAMQKSPEARYANGVSLAEDLERFLDGRPVRAKNPDVLDLAYLYVRRRPLVPAAAAVVFLAFFIVAWSANRLQWSQKKSKLLSRINRELTEPSWTPERLATSENLLAEMHEVDTVLERYLREDVIKRTHGAVTDLLEKPRLTEAQSSRVQALLEALIVHQHPESAALLEHWRARETAWQTIAGLRPPMSQESASAIFRHGEWEVKAGQLFAVPAGPEKDWTNLFSPMDLDGSVELEADFGPHWNLAPACGVALVIPLLNDLQFYVFQAERFALRRPDFPNPENAPVMAILSEMTPLVYEVLPKEARGSPRLELRARYENGNLSMTVNGGETLRHSRIFELARPLAKANFSLLLPARTSLARLELRQRLATAPASPLVKADDLVSAGRPQEALPVYEKFLNNPEVKTECLYKYAACLEALQRPQEGFAAWGEVAQGAGQPWKSLAMFQLWRGHLAQGDMETANSWFDLLMAGDLPEVVRTGIPTADRLLLNQHYLPVTRSLNCLKARPEDVADLDRAVRVQQFLGADDRQIAVRTGMAFHFAGNDQHARNLYQQAVVAVRPSVSLPPADILSTMICLDQWASLGGAEGDAVLQPAITSWMHALKGSSVPARAVPALEDLRHELRLGLTLGRSHRGTAAGLVRDPQVPLRYRVEASLIAGMAESLPEGRQKAWREAVRSIDFNTGLPDRTQHMLHAQFMARCLDQSWTPAQAAEWLTTLFGKARPVVSREKWTGPMVQTLAGSSLAKGLNQLLDNESGRQYARDYILRNRPARELAHEGMKLVLAAVFCEGSGWPMDNPQIQESARRIVSGFCARQFTEVALIQLFSLWNGVKNFATWEMLDYNLDPALREPLVALLVRRYEKLGQPEKAAEFGARP